MKIRVFEAFAGYGSQAIALRNLAKDYPELQFEHVGVSEINKPAYVTYKIMNGFVKNYGDIAQINWLDVPDFDLFTYSFPCTDISKAGLLKGFKEGSGTSSSLLWECKRAIEGKRPKWLVMENVNTIIGKQFLPEFEKWIRWLSEQGYNSYYQVLNAEDFGVPQSRKRCFMVSIQRENGARVPYTFPNPIPLKKSLWDYLLKEVDESYYLRTDTIKNLIGHVSRLQEEGYRSGLRFRFADRDYPRCVCGTITLKYGTRNSDTYICEPRQHPHDEPPLFYDGVNLSQYRVRKLTPYETGRLMGIPLPELVKMLHIGYSDVQLYKMQGNSIVVDVLYYVFRNLFVKESER